MDPAFATALPSASLELLERLDARAARFLNGLRLERFSVRSADGGVHTEVREIDPAPLPVEPVTAAVLPPRR